MVRGLLNVVHGTDGLLSIVLVGVPNEAKSTAATSVAILDNHLLRGRQALVRSMHLQTGGGYRPGEEMEGATWRSHSHQGPNKNARQ